LGGITLIAHLVNKYDIVEADTLRSAHSDELVPMVSYYNFDPTVCFWLAHAECKPPYRDEQKVDTLAVDRCIARFKRDCAVVVRELQLQSAKEEYDDP
jgi:hypothetical protein